MSVTTASLRRAVTGLIGLAAAEEQRLVVGADPAEAGGPQCWPALAVVAHNTEFRRQQVTRLRAIRVGRTPLEFADVDHESGELYAGLSAQPADAVAAESWLSAGDLLAELQLTRDDDLLDPARNPWLRGRQLWLQIVVRGYWHPAGHLGAYYAGHGDHDQSLALAAHAVATAEYLDAPDQARGMACYNLACAQAGAGQLDAAQAALAAAVALNPDLRANAARDGDLAALRDRGRIREPCRGNGDR
jgi:hypothetical protein